MAWQSRLYREYFDKESIPQAVDVPTGFGKTAVAALWLLAIRAGRKLPRRLVYVVDRRAVVDQATTFVEEMRQRLPDGEKFAISTLRGQHADNRDWLSDPTAPAIIVGTVDMIGSRLLFSGYGVSRKMRPYHAGLLGSDTLIVLDESHLVPPFEKLLEAIENGNAALGPQAQKDRDIVPAFKLLSLSATGRTRKGEIFRLEEEKGDLNDETAKARLGAKKSLTIKAVIGMEEALAEQAWALSGKGAKSVRVLVYCNSRRVAEKAKKAIEKRAKGGKKNGISKTAIETELFVGARRVKERVDAAKRLKTLGFIAGSDINVEKPAFLIATSAGEVGVDLDADHMVCDLVPWERMVQRFGRVNRRGEGEAQIVCVHEGEPKAKKPNAPKPEELRAMIAWRSLTLLDHLRTKGSVIDVSPGALQELKRRAAVDSKLREKIVDATTPPPLYPALTRALADAWSMTSLKEHTGRPGVAPWLRGWIDDSPQTAVVWRRYLPVRSEGSEASRSEVEDFFEAAPPHLSEKLETEVWRVAAWLATRAKKVRGPNGVGIGADEIVAFALSPNGDLRKRYRLDELVKSAADKNRKKAHHDVLAGATLVVDARLGGLKDGLLDDGVDGEDLRSADDADAWPVDIQFDVHAVSRDEPFGSDTCVSHTFATRRSREGEEIEGLVIKTKTTERSRATSSHPQLLNEHQAWTEVCARKIAAAVGLTGNYAKTLAIAAHLHDEGKKAARWQEAFNAPKNGIYAKTKGPLFQSRLGGYRHEFGSLPHAENNEAFRQLPSDLQDLVLHLIAAHHGRARPVIETKGCEDAPPSRLEERACDVALRFARLQKRWGPWGLAWWESLLRAADQQASRENDERARANGRS